MLTTVTTRTYGPCTFLSVLGFGALVSACDAMESEPATAPLNVQQALNIEADPVLGRDPVTGAPTSNNLYALYDLDTGAIVLSSSEVDVAARR